MKNPESDLRVVISFKLKIVLNDVHVILFGCFQTYFELKKNAQCGLLFNNLLSFSCVCAVFVLPRLFSRVFASSLQILFSIFRILLRKIFEIQSEFLSVVLYDYELKFILQFIIYPEIRTDVFNFFAIINLFLEFCQRFKFCLW